MTPPAKVFPSRRRGAVSAEVYTDDDVKDYVKKVILEPIQKLKQYCDCKPNFPVA